jgi:hypothetical protein
MRVARMARGQHGLFSELNWQTRVGAAEIQKVLRAAGFEP